MQRKANDIINEEVKKLEEENEFQRLVLVKALQSNKKIVNENMQLFEDLAFIIEKQQKQIDLLDEIKKEELTDIKKVLLLISELKDINDITLLLSKKLDLFLILDEIFVTNNILKNSIFKYLDISLGENDKHYNNIIKENKEIKTAINSQYKILKLKKEGEYNE